MTRFIISKFGLLWFGALFLVGCGGRANTEAGGETHWLSVCSEQAPCDNGLSCLCGRCTTVCEQTSDCARLSEQAVCATTEQVAFADACDAPARALCISTGDSRVEIGTRDAASDVTVDAGAAIGATVGAEAGSRGMVNDTLATVDASSLSSENIDVRDAGVGLQPQPSDAEVLTDSESIVPEGPTFLSLELTPSLTSTSVPLAEQLVASTWLVNLDVTRQDAAASVWLVTTGQRGDDPSQDPTGHSSSSANTTAQVVDGSTLVLQPVTLALSESETLDVAELSLTWDKDGGVWGTASGQWSYFGGDYILSSAFTAEISGGVDSVAPSLTLGQTLLVPSDPLSIALSEPVHAEETVVRVTANGVPWEGEMNAIADNRDGYLIGLQLVPQFLWPAGEIEIELVASDAAGNAPTSQSQAVAVAAAPDTSSNLTFESSGGWLGPVVTVAEYTSPGESYPVAAPQGQFMAVISSVPAVGYLQAPPGVSQLCFAAGIGGSTAVASWAGIQTRMASEVDLSQEQFSAADFPSLPSTTSTWSGLSDLCAALPLGANDGFWLSIQTTGNNGPAWFEGVIDDLRFQ